MLVLPSFSERIHSPVAFQLHAFGKSLLSDVFRRLIFRISLFKFFFFNLIGLVIQLGRLCFLCHLHLEMTYILGRSLNAFLDRRTNLI